MRKRNRRDRAVLARRIAEMRVEREVTTNRFLRRRLSIFPDERVKVPCPRLRPLVTATFSPGRLPIVVIVVVVIRARTRPGRVFTNAN